MEMNLKKNIYWLMFLIHLKLTQNCKLTVCVCVCVCVCVSCLVMSNLSNPMDSVHRILQARILEWIAISFSRRSFQPRDPTQGWNPYLLSLLHLIHQGSTYTTTKKKKKLMTFTNEKIETHVINKCQRTGLPGPQLNNMDVTKKLLKDTKYHQ